MTSVNKALPPNRRQRFSLGILLGFVCHLSLKRRGMLDVARYVSGWTSLPLKRH
jgi:hypothetical protein